MNGTPERLKTPCATQWKCHTPALLKEILNNSQCAALLRPLQIFASILNEAATRASEINDAKLNACMAKLTLYEICDPYSKEYNPEIWEKLINGKIGIDAVAIIEKRAPTCDWQVRKAVAYHYEFVPCGKPGKFITSGPAWQHGTCRCPKHTKP